MSQNAYQRGELMRYSTYSDDLPDFDAATMRTVHDLLQGRDMLRKLVKADSVELKVRRFCPRDQILVLDPDDPFHVGDGSDEIWLAAHPDNEEAARELLEAARPTPPESGGDDDGS